MRSLHQTTNTAGKHRKQIRIRKSRGTAGNEAGYPDQLPGSDRKPREKLPKTPAPTRNPRQKLPDHNPAEHYTNPIQIKA